jgi:hypothetical protein
VFLSQSNGGFAALAAQERWRANQSKLSAVLWAFFDESGKLARSDFICLCGYVCDDGWKNFGTQWGDLLRRHGLPLLHLAKLMRKAEPFDKLTWTDEQRDAALLQYVGPIREHLFAGFGVGLDAKHYRSMPAKARKLIGEDDAQDFAFYRVMRLLIEQLRAWGYREPISVNFDYTEDFSVKCIQSLAKLRSGRPEVKALISSIGFADDSVYYPLQAADMLAYGTYGWMRGAAPAYQAALIAPGTPDNRGPTYSSMFYSSTVLDETYAKLKRSAP